MKNKVNKIYVLDLTRSEILDLLVCISEALKNFRRQGLSEFHNSNFEVLGFRLINLLHSDEKV